MSDPLSATFAALADPTRRAILAQLAHGERSVSDLAKPFAMTAPAIAPQPVASEIVMNFMFSLE